MQTREITILPVDKIVISGGRELDVEAVNSIASSIELLGLQNPISVVADDEGGYRIISGRHRLAATRLLGRAQIDAFVYRGLSELDARLAEISENLHRAELTVQQRSEQIAEYAKLVKEKREQGSAQVGQHLSNAKGASGREGGDSAAARDLGLSRQAIQRAGKIANLAPAAKTAAKKAGLDNNQKALLKAAEAPEGKQAAVIEEYAAAKATKPKADRRVANSVGATVKAILRDFEAADVQAIIKGLREALDKRAAGITPEAPAREAETQQSAKEAQALASPETELDTDPNPEIIEEVEQPYEEPEIEKDLPTALRRQRREEGERIQELEIPDYD